MAVRQDYFDLLDWLESRKPVDPKEFFNRMRSAYGIVHLLYVDAVVFSGGVRLYRLHHTLAKQQESALMALGQRTLLPPLMTILSSVRPIEHSMLATIAPKSQPLITKAETFGISTEGISYPLVTPAGRAAAMSISAPVNTAELPLYLRTYGRDIHALSALFHAALIEADNVLMPVANGPALTPREREVLQWSASGKSYWEIAVILGISERTVRFFMNNARRKLDVVSNTQAVAEAVWRGIIPHG